jgi:hypothetical protein
MAAVDAKWTKIQDTVTAKLQQMIERGKSGRAFIAARVVPKYKEFQMLRWASEDQGQWPALKSASYMAWKKRKFADSIGQGERMMIASGKLLNSVLVQSGGFGYQMITEDQLIIGLDASEIDYAKYANEVRNFMDFPDEFMAELRQEYRDYMLGLT